MSKWLELHDIGTPDMGIHIVAEYEDEVLKFDIGYDIASMVIGLYIINDDGDHVVQTDEYGYYLKNGDPVKLIIRDRKLKIDTEIVLGYGDFIELIDAFMECARYDMLTTLPYATNGVVS